APPIAAQLCPPPAGGGHAGRRDPGAAWARGHPNDARILRAPRTTYWPFLQSRVPVSLNGTAAFGRLFCMERRIPVVLRREAIRSPTQSAPGPANRPVPDGQEVHQHGGEDLLELP